MSEDSQNSKTPVQQQRTTNQPFHLQEYLDYYTSLSAPGYAVLVTGKWGTGKTHQVCEILPKGKAYYVSLFGLSSADEVTASVFAAMYPTKAKAQALANRVSEITAEVPGFGSLAVSGIASALAGAFIRQEATNDLPLIFDDLERCTLGTREILGIINRYVEHHECRVIVIAHDKKMTRGFKKAKEKVFGHTIEVEPQLDAAFDAFTANIDDSEGREFVSDRRELILDVFRQSDVQSLRILRQLLQDIARLSPLVSDKQRAHQEAMAQVVQLFSAINIEWRSARLKSQDLFNRSSTAIQYTFGRSPKDPPTEPPWIVQARGRYSSIDLSDNLLNDSVLADMLVRGKFEKEAIQASINASSFFSAKAALQPWEVIWEFHRQEDKDVRNALAQLRRQFKKLEIIESGEMLHMFALRMFLASKEVWGRNVEDAAKECRTYIDKLLAAGRLPARELDWRWAEGLERSSHGKMYWIEDGYKSLFAGLHDYLLEARTKALNAEFPNLVTEILGAMSSNAEEFFGLLCHTRDGQNKYVSVPVLIGINPKRFVRIWMSAPKRNWRTISMALEARYAGGRLSQDLKAEADWIAKVIELLNEEAKGAKGLAKVRLEGTIPSI